MVDIGLGPTFGHLISWRKATKRSPRRVQTDAYHRPCVLNYLPFISPPSQESAKRLPEFYPAESPSVNRHFPADSKRLFAPAPLEGHGLIKAIFMGTPSSVVPVLRRLNELPGLEVAAAVTPPDRRQGRGRRPESPPVKQEALNLGIPVLQPQTLRSEHAQKKLAALDPSVVIVAAYGRLLPPAVLGIPAHGCLNLHPSLLPRHRGPSPAAAAILEGDEVTGVSLMLLDEGMDTGPIIASSAVELQGNERAGELTDRLFNQGGELLSDCLEPWVRGELEARPQDDAQATVSRKLERADGQADWSLPAETLARQCRAYDPWPSLFTQWRGKTLKLLDVSAHPGVETESVDPGTITHAGPGKGLYVVTSKGSLNLKRVQLEGRRPVTGEEFLRGYPDVTGACLGSPAIIPGNNTRHRRTTI